MAARAFWNGHIRLSLVTFPVRLYPAVTETEKIRLHKIERKTGKRIHYKNATEGEDIVEAADIVKGYEYEKGQYIQIEDEELKKLRVQSKHMIDLVQFTDIHDIDPIYFDKPYFLVPDGRVAEEAFVTLRDSLKKSKKVALGQVTIAGKERIAAIKPCGKGLVLETLRYAGEVQKASEYFRDIPDKSAADEEQVELAEQLIDRKTAPFDPSSFKDSYQQGLLEIINAKLHHRKPKLGPEPVKPGKVINIMDALKKSLAESGGKGKTSAKADKPAAKKHAPAKKKRKAG
ncbi:MAG TPA: Ku protein [Patescibacteria group bacterium]|nr:Ku protein [Patescibacteria group bacterium]